MWPSSRRLRRALGLLYALACLMVLWGGNMFFSAVHESATHDIKLHAGALALLQACGEAPGSGRGGEGGAWASYIVRF